MTTPKIHIFVISTHFYGWTLSRMAGASLGDPLKKQNPKKISSQAQFSVQGTFSPHLWEL